jgi:hypothetical protein
MDPRTNPRSTLTKAATLLFSGGLATALIVQAGVPGCTSATPTSTSSQTPPEAMGLAPAAEVQQAEVATPPAPPSPPAAAPPAPPNPPAAAPPNPPTPPNPPAAAPPTPPNPPSNVAPPTPPTPPEPPPRYIPASKAGIMPLEFGHEELPPPPPPPPQAPPQQNRAPR